MKELEKQDIKMQVYWTLGRYASVTIIKAPSEEDVKKILIAQQNVVETETLIAVPLDEALDLL